MGLKKILFVCGSIEPGQDGVGDYTRELAGELYHRGVETKIISIKDRNVVGISEEIQIARNGKVNVKRLSEKLSFQKRRNVYRELIAEFKPDWISLQYVPYAFSVKGLPFDLVQFLKIKRTKIKWHFMIHEAYVWQNLNFKRKVLKYLEILILKNLVRSLAPMRIHTSNSFYQKLLKDISIKSDRLELFGNIDIIDENFVGKSEIRQGVFFGAGPIHNHFSFFSNGLKSFFKQTNDALNIVFCGRADFRTTDFVAYLKSELSDFNVNILEKGSLESEELSLLLLQSHFGISREPPQLMGKSGTVAVMLEHGLPLWVPLAENKNSFIDKFDFRLEQCIINLNELLKSNSPQQFAAKSRIEDISNQFYTSLKTAGG